MRPSDCICPYVSMVSLKTASARSSRPRTTWPQPMKRPASAMVPPWDRVKGEPIRSAPKCASYHHLLDLVGPLADSQDLRVPVEAAHRVLLDVAVAAVDLHGLLGGTDGEPAGLQLGLGGGEREV